MHFSVVCVARGLTAHHPSVSLEGGTGSGVRRYVCMGISGNEGRVIQLSKTQ